MNYEFELRLMRHLSMCTDEWRSTTAPQSSPQKIAEVRSQLCLKRISKGPSSEDFLGTQGRI